MAAPYSPDAEHRPTWELFSYFSSRMLILNAYFEYTDFRGANLQGANFEDTSGQKII